MVSRVSGIDWLQVSMLNEQVILLGMIVELYLCLETTNNQWYITGVAMLACVTDRAKGHTVMPYVKRMLACLSSNFQSVFLALIYRHSIGAISSGAS